MDNLFINRKNITKIDMLYIQGGITGSAVWSRYKPDYLINLALYDTTSGIGLTRLEDENIKIGYLFSDYGIGIKGDKDLVWVKHSEAYKYNDIRDFVSGSPILTEHKKTDIDWGNKYSSYLDKVHKRSLFGYNDSFLVLSSPSDKMSIPKLARYARDHMGLTYALNLDGGGSCYLRDRVDTHKYSYRKNASWLLVYVTKKEKFINLVLDQLGKDYIYAANGEIITTSKLNQFISWFGRSHYKTSYFDASKNINDTQDFDCSGLFVYVMRELDVISGKSDYTAQGLYNMCKKINTNELKNGDLLFRTGRSGTIGHVGMYYNGLVVHAKGTAYGVVATDEVSTFDKFGRLSLVD